MKLSYFLVQSFFLTLMIHPAFAEEFEALEEAEAESLHAPVKKKASAQILKAQELINLADYGSQSSISPASIKVLGEKIQKFLFHPENSSVLKTPEGSRLRDIQIKLAQAFKAQSKLSQCVQDQSGRANLASRIGNGIIHGSECKSSLDATGLSKITDFSKVLSALDSEEKADVSGNAYENAIKFRSLIIEQGLKDALKSYIDLEYKYSGKSAEIDPRKVFNDLFEVNGSIHSRFDSAVKDDAIREAADYIKDLKAKVKPVSQAETLKYLNAKISQLGAAYKGVPAKPFEGTIRPVGPMQYTQQRLNKNKQPWTPADQRELDKKKLEREAKINEFSKWSGQHLAEALSNPAGTLLLTSAITKYYTPALKHKDDASGKVEGLHALFKDDTVKFNKIPGTADVSAAILEAQREIKDYGQYMAKMNYQKPLLAPKGTNIDLSTVQDHLASMASRAPAALSQVLVKNPQYMGLACSTINDANSRTADQKQKDKVFMYGGMIVGGAAMLTFVGAGAGALLLSEAGAVYALSYTAAVAGGIGSAANLIGVGYHSQRRDELKKDHNQIKAALFASTTPDLQGWTEANNLLEDFEEANFNLGLASASLLVDSSVMGLTIKGISKAKQVKDLTRFVTGLMDDPSNISKINGIRKLLSKVEYDDFILKLSSSSLDKAKMTRILDDWSQILADLEKLERAPARSFYPWESGDILIRSASHQRDNLFYIDFPLPANIKARALSAIEKLLTNSDHEGDSGYELLVQYESILKGIKDPSVVKHIKTPDVLRAEQAKFYKDVFSKAKDSDFNTKFRAARAIGNLGKDRIGQFEHLLKLKNEAPPAMLSDYYSELSGLVFSFSNEFPKFTLEEHKVIFRLAGDAVRILTDGKYERSAKAVENYKILAAALKLPPEAL